DMMYKTLYHPDWTQKKIDLQSHHFIHNLENSINYYHNLTGKFATLTTPFDTELFGHWWFEGPEFIRAVIKGLHYSPWVKIVKAAEQLDIIKPQEVVRLPEGSWGVNNDHTVWINEGNKWTWEMIYNDEKRFGDLLAQFPYLQDNSIENPIPNEETKILKRIILQALRELMLAQSSDWQFLIYTNASKDYAEQRFFFHHSDFNRLCDSALKLANEHNLTNDEWLYISEIEERDNVFPELKLENWKKLD
ncbi:MAG TPA: DUF1957 domain-containing protein, partial [Bacteroidota bacterium]|nr:DUF1957 domain-containing protein [Bacteroidota bacterium]